jgi:hypothetical protein
MFGLLLSPTEDQIRTPRLDMPNLTICDCLENLSGYRMGQVNSRGESWLSESDSKPVSAPGGEQPTPENSGAPGLFKAYPRAESGFAHVALAEGEELSSKPLCGGFQGLSITFHLAN